MERGMGKRAQGWAEGRGQAWAEGRAEDGPREGRRGRGMDRTGKGTGRGTGRGTRRGQVKDKEERPEAGEGGWWSKRGTHPNGFQNFRSIPPSHFLVHITKFLPFSLKKLCKEILDLEGGSGRLESIEEEESGKDKVQGWWRSQQFQI
jgi:hypothetical protein